MFKARFENVLNHVSFRTFVSFWLLGLINNVLYVIILSAALDLVGPTIPKSAVLLFDVVPSFLVKLTAPYYIHVVPYSLRVLIFVALSTCGMLLIALTPSSVSPGPGKTPGVPQQKEILVKMIGVVLASLSSGGGELSFIGLTHFYGPHSLAAWGSGTGGAGLIGAGAYVLTTTTLGLSVRSSLLVFSLLPVIMLLSYFLILPNRPIKPRHQSYESLPNDDLEDAQDEVEDNAEDRLTDTSTRRLVQPVSKHKYSASKLGDAWIGFRTNLRRAQGLVLP